MQFKKHALNAGFEWQPIRGPFRRLSQAQVDRYNEQGWFVLEDAIAPEVIERLITEIDPFEHETEDFLATQRDGRMFIARSGELTFTTHLVTRSKVLKDFVRCEVFRDIVSDLLGPDVRLYWDQAVYKKPGNRDVFPWHQDNGYTFTDPQQYLTCWLALSDATEANGCPEVAPGVHREGTLEHELTPLGFRCLPADFAGVVAPIRAGSMVVFSSLSPHRTGPNVSNDIRKAYIVQFAPDGAAHVSVDASGIETRIPASVPDRQFAVLRNGCPVEED